MKIQEIIGWNNLKLDRRRTGVRQDNAVRFFAIINPIRTGGVGGGGGGGPHQLSWTLIPFKVLKYWTPNFVTVPKNYLGTFWYDMLSVKNLIVSKVSVYWQAGVLQMLNFSVFIYLFIYFFSSFVCNFYFFRHFSAFFITFGYFWTTFGGFLTFYNNQKIQDSRSKAGHRKPKKALSD